MKNKKLIICLAVIIVIAAVVIAGLAMQGPKSHVQELPMPTELPADDAAAADGDESVTNVEIAPLVIATRYFSCTFPADCSDYLRHKTIEDNGVISEAFSFIYEEVEYDVFTFTFADPDSGMLVGYFDTDSGLVPVTYTAPEYTDAELEAIGAKEIYFKLMEQFNPILDGIMGDSRFRADATDASAAGEAALRYWSVYLPNGMEWEETEVGNEYRADFYGNIAGARTMLYTIYIGGEASETRSSVGRFRTDGKWREVFIESHPPQNVDDWTEAEMAAFGGMMDTVNASLEAIMASPDYSDGR